MDSSRALWGENQKRLRSMLLKSGDFEKAMELCLKQHALVHLSEVSGCKTVTFEDELWDGLKEETFRKKPSQKDDTIAWDLWHIARIEDITMNLLVAEEGQVINSCDWIKRMKATVCDTGNAMNHEEIIKFSEAIDIEELKNYRIAVGKRTREIIKSLKSEDLKKKVSEASLKRVLEEGAVLEVEESRWLIDFWGRKNTAGILLMPVTRHNLVHINDALRIKNKLKN